MLGFSSRFMACFISLNCYFVDNYIEAVWWGKVNTLPMQWKYHSIKNRKLLFILLARANIHQLFSKNVIFDVWNLYDYAFQLYSTSLLRRKVLHFFPGYIKHLRGIEFVKPKLVYNSASRKFTFFSLLR